MTKTVVTGFNSSLSLSMLGETFLTENTLPVLFCPSACAVDGTNECTVAQREKKELKKNWGVKLNGNHHFFQERHLCSSETVELNPNEDSC